jgi:hypothetical protein
MSIDRDKLEDRLKWRGSPLRSLSAALSTILVLMFLTVLYFLIANASQTAAIVGASRDLDDGYKKLTDLFEAKRLADQEAVLADFDVSRNENIRRDDIIANQKRLAAGEAFTKQTFEYFGIVCFSIVGLKELHYPARVFVSEVGVADCAPQAAPKIEDQSAGSSTEEQRDEKPRVIPRTTEQNIYVVKQRILAAANVSNFYILPVLFGCMGALIFALRELLADDQRWFNLRDVLGYYLRIALGGICGMIIGYFNIASVSSASTSLAVSASPLILSLVAGFSVDSVISVLERIALAIRYENDPSHFQKQFGSSPERHVAPNKGVSSS